MTCVTFHSVTTNPLVENAFFKKVRRKHLRPLIFLMKQEDAFFAWTMQKEWPQVVCFTRFNETSWVYFKGQMEKLDWTLDWTGLVFLGG